MPSQKYLDLFKDRPDVGDLGFRRLKPALDAADVALFKDLPPHEVPGTGSVFVTVGQGGTWGRDAYHRGAHHPLMVVNIYSDHSRDEQGEVTKHDARNKALAVFDYLDALLDGMTQATWPEIITCRRDSEPTFITIPDGLGAELLHVRYEVSHL